MTQDRLDHIETALAHQERQIQDLSDMIGQQWKHIEILTQRLEAAQGKLSLLESLDSDKTDALSVSDMAALEKPPHY